MWIGAKFLTGCNQHVLHRSAAAKAVRQNTNVPGVRMLCDEVGIKMQLVER